MSGLSCTIVSLSRIRLLLWRHLRICALTSCSIDCFRHHIHPNNPPQPIATSTLGSDLPPKPPLAVLPGESHIRAAELGHGAFGKPVGFAIHEELKLLFRLYPQLRELLYVIYKSTIDSASKEKVEQHHNRGRFEHTSKRGRGGSRYTHTLLRSQQRDSQNGLYTLRKLRYRNTVNSEALEAFSELVAKSTRNAIAR